MHPDPQEEVDGTELKKDPKVLATEGITSIWAALDPRKKTPKLRNEFNDVYCFIRDAQLPVEDEQPEDPEKIDPPADQDKPEDQV